jgi:hypothetical protein
VEVAAINPHHSVVASRLPVPVTLPARILRVREVTLALPGPSTDVPSRRAVRASVIDLQDSSAEYLRLVAAAAYRESAALRKVGPNGPHLVDTYV